MLAAAEGAPGRRTAAAFREEYMMVKKDAKQKKVRITNCETCAFYTYDDEYGYYKGISLREIKDTVEKNVRQISTRTRCPRSSAEVIFPAASTSQMTSMLL